MIVIADSSPIHYLVLIGEIDILRQLYERVVIPSTVYQELTDTRTPVEIARWISGHPAWVEVRTIVAGPADPGLAGLDPGERAAIIIAQSEEHPLLLIDDAASRAEARRRGIANTGTLGVLRAASIRQLLDLPAAISRLATTNFRISPSLILELLAEDAERNQHGADQV